MKRWSLLVCAVVVLAVMLVSEGTARAAGGAETAAVDPMLLAGSRLIGMEYEVMVEALGLTEQQQAQVSEKLIALGKAEADWTKANGAKVEELNEAIRKAREADDREASSKAYRERMALYIQRTADIAPHRAALLAVLTPEQRAKLGTLLLSQRVEKRWRSLQLTDEQKALIAASCEAAVKASPDLDVTDGRAIAAVMRKIFGEARQKVLTDEQREKEDGLPRRRSRRTPTTEEAKPEAAEEEAKD